ncbi:MAG: hypothetical protein C4322_16355, partial [Mastigocladus sp. ERB_26_1]
MFPGARFELMQQVQQQLVNTQVNNTVDLGGLDRIASLIKSIFTNKNIFHEREVLYAERFSQGILAGKIII